MVSKDRSKEDVCVLRGVEDGGRVCQDSVSRSDSNNQIRVSPVTTLSQDGVSERDSGLWVVDNNPK